MSLTNQASSLFTLCQQFIKYGLVGGVNTLVGVSLMALGHQLGWHYMAYTTFGYGIAMGVSFILNFHFTFQVKHHVRRRIVRFFMVNITLLFAVQGLQILLIEYISTPELLGVGISMVIYTLIGFFLNRSLVFTTQ